MNDDKKPTDEEKAKDLPVDGYYGDEDSNMDEDFNLDFLDEKETEE